jgi:enoyl-CoA hydratase/carnithine racemase
MATQGLRVVDLNRPKVLNCINTEMVETLLPLVVDWQQPGGDVKLVVIRGSGEKAFCAGGDLKFLHACTTRERGFSPSDALDLCATESALNQVV